MTRSTSSAAKAGDAPNKPSPEGSASHVVATAQTPRRDVDLFGPTTVRIDRTAGPDAAGVPILYLSAYVEDPEQLTQRLLAALAWLGEGGLVPASVETLTPANDGPYSLPDFVEDVDYAERLALAEDPAETDWKAWSAAIVRRITLATTAGQLASLEAANAIGLKLCPYQNRAGIAKALREAHEVTFDQAAAA